MLDVELRDWFAGMALSAMAARAAYDSQSARTCSECGGRLKAIEPLAARAAYDWADAMMEARERRYNTEATQEVSDVSDSKNS